MRQIYIHIGTHKTGTTSIQSLLCRREARLQRAGIYVPKTGRPFPNSAGHHNIGWMLRGDDRKNPTLGGIQELARELAACPFQKAVISDEDLQFLVIEPELIRKLEDTLHDAGWKPHYILFLRDPVSYSISFYNEALKIQPDLCFYHFIEMILQQGYFQRKDRNFIYFDYETFLSRWQAMSHADIGVYSYNAASSGAGVMETFISAIGIPDAHKVTQEARTPRQMWAQVIARLKVEEKPPLPKTLRLNHSQKPVTEDMLLHAAKVGTAYHPAFERMTAHCEK